MSAAGTTGFFTLGVSPDRYHLPHPRIPFPVILLIRRVLMRAFALLREEQFNLADATEDQVTAALRTIMESNLRQSGEVPGFNKRRFETVIRQGQWANHDGTRITKTPDLFLKLRDDETEARPVLSEFEGVFIEAKPVDSRHSVGARYCDDGIIRFIRGDYAWAMQDAMMLAYTRDGRTISTHLVPAMNEAARQTSLAVIQFPQSCPEAGAAACPGAETIHISQHRRSFQWLHGKGQATDITVYHLWYEC